VFQATGLLPGKADGQELSEQPAHKPGNFGIRRFHWKQPPSGAAGFIKIRIHFFGLRGLGLEKNTVFIPGNFFLKGT